MTSLSVAQRASNAPQVRALPAIQLPSVSTESLVYATVLALMTAPVTMRALQMGGIEWGTMSAGIIGLVAGFMFGTVAYLFRAPENG